jgi:hypothetical protein
VVWRIVRIATALIIAGSMLTMAVLAVVYLPRIGQPVGEAAHEAFSQAEFVTIILTAVTVILAALTIVLALAGAVGYVTIRDAARGAAEAAARERAEEVARSVAGRVAESVATQVSGRSQDAGDQIARAAGDDDVGSDTRSHTV